MKSDSALERISTEDAPDTGQVGPVGDDAEEFEEWTTIVDSKRPWFDFNLGELWRFRDLILLFVRRDFRITYVQTVLGPLWLVLAPFLTTVVFTIIFGKVVQVPTDGIPSFVFYMSGTVCWSYFSSSVSQTSTVLIKNYRLFQRVHFPRLVMPVSLVMSNLIKFAIQFSFFLVFLVYFVIQGSGVAPNMAMLALPLLVLHMAVLSLGCGLIVAGTATRYRDLIQLTAFGLQLWMYATPVVYPVSQIPERFRFFFALNPMTAVVETFRYAFLGKSSVSSQDIVTSAVVTVILLLAGLIMFTRMEKTFLDTA